MCPIPTSRSYKSIKHYLFVDPMSNIAPQQKRLVRQVVTVPAKLRDAFDALIQHVRSVIFIFYCPV